MNDRVGRGQRRTANCNGGLQQQTRTPEQGPLFEVPSAIADRECVEAVCPSGSKKTMTGYLARVVPCPELEASPASLARVNGAQIHRAGRRSPCSKRGGAGYTTLDLGY